MAAAVNDHSHKLVTVIGGSGFLGRHIVRALAKDGYRIRVAVRRPDLAGHVQPLGKVGQIVPVQANLRYPDSLDAACTSAYAVINLVGILHRTGPQTFESIHAQGAEAAALAASRAGAAIFIQMSALGADPDSASAYAQPRPKARSARAAPFRAPSSFVPRSFSGLRMPSSTALPQWPGFLPSCR